MHELGIISQVAKVAQRAADESGMKHIQKIVLQVGELTSVIPKYALEVFPMVTYKTPLEKTELEVEEIPGIAQCKICDKQFNIVKCDGVCPACQSKEHDILSGTQLQIKEIVAY